MTSAPCSCDDSKEWQLRALRAEAKARALQLALKFARQQLEGLLGAEVEVSPLREVYSLEGLSGFCGGSDQERQAAVAAATKAEV